MSKSRIAPSLRLHIAAISQFRCGYCLTSQKVIGPFLEIDHIIPESLGGTSVEENLVLACPMCNGHKAARVTAVDSETGETVPLFNPRKDEWATHFQWIEGNTVIRGNTSTGKATAEALMMNHPDMVSARQMWVLVGWHPPQD